MVKILQEESSRVTQELATATSNVETMQKEKEQLDADKKIAE